MRRSRKLVGFPVVRDTSPVAKLASAKGEVYAILVNLHSVLQFSPCRGVKPNR